MVGVCGGDEGPSCWAKLKFGVAGLMAAKVLICCDLVEVLWHKSEMIVGRSRRQCPR